MNQEAYLDLKRLSKYSSLSVRTLRGHLGEIPYYRVGGKLLVKKSDFDNFIEQHKVVNNLDEIVEDIVNEIRA